MVVDDEFLSLLRREALMLIAARVGFVVGIALSIGTIGMWGLFSTPHHVSLRFWRSSLHSSLLASGPVFVGPNSAMSVEKQYSTTGRGRK
jgi:hypothetical protein